MTVTHQTRKILFQPKGELGEGVSDKIKRPSMETLTTKQNYRLDPEESLISGRLLRFGENGPEMMDDALKDLVLDEWETREGGSGPRVLGN